MNDEIKDYYMTLSSPEKIMEHANADMALACVIDPEQMAEIRQAAEEIMREKFGKEIIMRINKDKIDF